MIDRSRILAVRLGLMATIVLILTLSLLALVTLNVLNSGVRPELRDKLVMVGDALVADLDRVSGLKIPLKEEPGLAAWLDQAMARTPELTYIALTDDRGELLADTHTVAPELLEQFRKNLVDATAPPDLAPIGHSLDLALPVFDDKKPAAWLHLGVSDGLIAERLQSILLDVGVSLFVSIVVSLEVLTALIALTITQSLTRLGAAVALALPTLQATTRDELGRLIQAVQSLAHRIGTRAERLMRRGVVLSDQTVRTFVTWHASAETKAPVSHDVFRMRLALFVYVFGVEMVRPFLVFFINDLYTPDFPLSRHLAVSLPYITWGLAAIAATPFGYALNRRFSPRVVFVGGCLLAIAASLLMAIATNLYQVVVFRTMIGIATGVVTLAGLVYVTGNAAPNERARSMAIFVGANVAGGIGGTAFGGILAGEVGFRPIFIVISTLVAVAALLGLWLLPETPNRETAQTQGSARTTFTILLDARVIALSLLLIIPGRVVIYGAFNFVLPLLLSKMAIGQSLIGHIMMSYFLIIAVLSPLVSRLSDRYACHHIMLGLGAALSGFSAVTMALGGSGWTELAAVLVLGLGQAVFSTSQYAVVDVLFRPLCSRHGTGSVTSALRIVEMTSAVVAVPLISVTSGLFSYNEVVLWLGITTVTGAALGALLLLRPRPATAT